MDSCCVLCSPVTSLFWPTENLYIIWTYEYRCCCCQHWRTICLRMSSRMVFTARRSYAIAVLGVVILSVCHTHALWLIQRTYWRYFYTTWKGNPSSQMWFFIQLCSSWQDFNWLKASRGHCAIAELLVRVYIRALQICGLLCLLYLTYWNWIIRLWMLLHPVSPFCVLRSFFGVLFYYSTADNGLHFVNLPMWPVTFELRLLSAHLLHQQLTRSYT